MLKRACENGSGQQIQTIPKKAHASPIRETETSDFVNLFLPATCTVWAGYSVQVTWKMEGPFPNAFVLTFGIILASFTLPNSYFLIQLSFPSPGSYPGNQPAQVSSWVLMESGLHNWHWSSFSVSRLCNIEESRRGCGVMLVAGFWLLL